MVWLSGEHWGGVVWLSGSIGGWSGCQGSIRGVVWLSGSIGGGLVVREH